MLPVGSFEQHGTFLPLTTDTLIVSAIAHRTADDHDLFLLHAAPEQVRPCYKDGGHLADNRPHLLVTGMPAYTPTGAISAACLAVPAKGAGLLASLSSSLRPYLDLFS